jgi:hypothetical protein
MSILKAPAQFAERIKRLTLFDFYSHENRRNSPNRTRPPFHHFQAPQNPAAR